MSTPAGAVIFSDLLLGAVVAASHKCRAKRYLSFIANIEDMDIEAEVVEMKQMLVDISRKIADVLDESMTAALMKLSEESILELYEDEPDLYSVADLKVRSS